MINIYSIFCTNNLFVYRLRGASILLEEAIEILSYEPEGTIEASRLKTALDFRMRLGNIVKDLEEYEKVLKTEHQNIKNSESEESKKEKVRYYFNHYLTNTKLHLKIHILCQIILSISHFITARYSKKVSSTNEKQEHSQRQRRDV